MRRKMIRNSAVFFLTLGMILMTAPVPAAADATLEGLNSEYSALEQKAAEVRQKLSQTKSEREKQEAIRQNLKLQISTARRQIEILSEKIAILEEEIEGKKTELTELSGEIEKQRGFFMRRIRSIYMSSVNSSILGRVLGVESIGAYLSCGKYLSRISEHDGALLESLDSAMERARVLKRELETDREDLTETMGLQEQKRESLSDLKKGVESTLHDIRKMEEEYLADQAAIQKEMDQVQKDIAAVYASRRSGSPVDYSGTGFIYPLEGRRAVSSGYGWRFGGSNFHTGIDFPAPRGTPIRASASGTVFYVRTGAGYGRKWGYGNYLIVDHGGGFSTLYAHCGGIAVSEGDDVSKGDTIAYVGTTGWSTGYHLHFEIRINGKHQNPLTYL